MKMAEGCTVSVAIGMWCPWSVSPPLHKVVSAFTECRMMSADGEATVAPSKIAVLTTASNDVEKGIYTSQSVLHSGLSLAIVHVGVSFREW